MTPVCSNYVAKVQSCVGRVSWTLSDGSVLRRAVTQHMMLTVAFDPGDKSNCAPLGLVVWTVL